MQNISSFWIVFGSTFGALEVQKFVSMSSTTDAKIGIETYGILASRTFPAPSPPGRPEAPPNRYSRILWFNQIKLSLIKLKIELNQIKSKIEVGVRVGG